MSTRIPRLAAALLAAAAVSVLAACGGTSDELGTPSTPPSTTAPVTAPPPATLPPDLAEVAERVRRSVVRVRVDGCRRGQRAEASGIVIGRRLVVTAAHVLRDAATVLVVQGGSGSEAVPVSVDEANGLALVRTQAILLGTALRFRTEPPPAPATVAAALGLPAGRDFTAVPATIGDGPGSLTFGDVQVENALRIAEPLDRAYSGGPLVDADGRAAGVLLVSQQDAAGTAIAVPAAVAQPSVATLRGARNASLLDCETRQTTPTPSDPPGDGDAVDQAAIDAIIEHYRRIDAGEFQGAFELMSPGYRARNPEWPAVREEGAPNIDQPSLRARGIEMVDASTALIGVELIAADTGGADAGLCRLFTGRITMRRIEGRWLYDPSPGFGPQDVDQDDPRCQNVK